MVSTAKKETQAEILQGTLDMLILQTIAIGPTHGHTIANVIARRSEDVLLVEHGSLYPALHRLEDRGWIASFWGTSENNREARYYRLTASGRKQLNVETSRWERVVRAVNQSKRQQIVRTGGDAEPVNSLFVTGDALRTLGVQPWRARLIVPDDERACPYSAVMVSYAYWQNKLGGREVDTASTRLIVDGVPAQVVGVTPPSFFGLAVGESFDIVTPLCQPPRLVRNVFDVTVMASWRRLRSMV